MNSLNSLEQWLKLRYVSVDKEWLKACVQWIEEESGGRTINLEQLKNAVYDQWLFSDLCEIGTISFPPNLANLQKTVLDGKYTVQVMSVRDVSQPAYAQLMKLQGKENDNVNVTAAPEQKEINWEPKNKRMLMLKITDGSQFVQAMEYKPIPSLNVNITPGIKLLLSGPIECRFGVLILTSEQVRVLGGDVESLADANNYQKVLANQLNQPDLAERKNVQENGVSDSPQPNVISVDPQVQRHSLLVNEPVIDLDDGFDDVDDEIFMDLSSESFEDLEYNNAAEHDRLEENIGDDLHDMDDVDFPSDIDLLDENDIPESPTTTSKLSLEKDERLNLANSLPTTSSQDTSRSSSRHQLPEEGRMIVPRGGKTLNCQENTDFEYLNESCSQQDHSVSSNILLGWESAPFTYLHYVLAQKSSSKTFIIKGYISCVTSKMTVKPDTGWRVQAMIDDGSASLEVIISNEVLTKFIGLTIQDVAKLKLEAKSDPSVLSKFNEAVTNCQETLVNLNCLMKIQLAPEAVLLRCAPVERYHIRQLLDRVINTS